MPSPHTIAKDTAKEITDALGQALQQSRIVDLSTVIPDGSLGPSKFQAGVINHTHLMPGVVERHLGYLPVSRAEVRSLVKAEQMSDRTVQVLVEKHVQPYVAQLHDVSLANPVLPKPIKDPNVLLTHQIDHLARALPAFIPEKKQQLKKTFEDILYELSLSLLELNATKLVEKLKPELNEILALLKPSETEKEILKQASPLSWCLSTTIQLAYLLSEEKSIVIDFRGALEKYLDNKAHFGFSLKEEPEQAISVKERIHQVIKRCKFPFELGITVIRVVSPYAGIGIGIAYNVVVATGLDKWAMNFALKCLVSLGKYLFEKALYPKIAEGFADIENIMRVYVFRANPLKPAELEQRKEAFEKLLLEQSKATTFENEAEAEEEEDFYE